MVSTERHRCTEFDEIYNPHSETFECAVCGKVFGKYGLIDYMMIKSHHGFSYSRLRFDNIKLSQHHGSSIQHEYANYAFAFFYDILEEE